MIQRWLLSFFFVILLISCVSHESKNIKDNNDSQQEIIFTYDKNGHIIIPALIRDSINTNLVFDTGDGIGLLLKQSFARANNLKFNGTKINAQLGLEESFSLGIITVKDSIQIEYGGAKIIFPLYYIVDDNSELGVIMGDAEGILPVGQVSSLQLNYSNSTIKLNQRSTCTYEDSLKVFRDSSGILSITQVPLFIGNDANNVFPIEDFIFDTGYRGDIYLNNVLQTNPLYEIVKTNSSQYFERKSSTNNITKQLFKIRANGQINRDIWAECDLLNSNWRLSSQDESYLIGVELQKSFDYYFDFVKNIVYLEPIQYTSIVNESSYLHNPNALKLAGRFKGNTLIAMYISEDSIYNEIGVQPGDIITSINHKPYMEMRDSINNNLLRGDISIEIERDGIPMTLIATGHNESF